MCAQEGLVFLSERKEFWQQQKPVYARKNEALAKRRAIYANQEPKAKASTNVVSSMLAFKALPNKNKPSLLAVGDTAFATIELASSDRRASLKEKESSIIDNAIDKKEIPVFE